MLQIKYQLIVLHCKNSVFRLIYNLIILLAVVASLLGCMDEHITRAKEENYFLTFTILCAFIYCMVTNFWLISEEVITFKTNLICISSILKSFTWVKYSKYFIRILV